MKLFDTPATMQNTIEIVCYAGGTCGDIITALIDPTESIINNNGTVKLPLDRSNLKKPHLFASDQDKLDYIARAGLLYNSIPSHDVEFHVRQSHNFIGIVIEHVDTAMWAATRFKLFHRPHVWEEMQRACGATTIEDYAEILMHMTRVIKQHTDRIITLESIRSGDAVNQIQKLVPVITGQSIYQHWIEKEHNK